jgi:UDP-N-acetylmuramate dehydrogenase
MDWGVLQRNVSLRTYTTLKAGGSAELFHIVNEVKELTRVVEASQREGIAVTPLGWGSNVLPSDNGVSGLVVINQAREILIEDDNVIADAGCGFQELVLKTAQANLGGLEFAVGIPGTLGGALVSNAGAYRSNISEFLTSIQITREGKTNWEDPSWMQFSYRDSILRKPEPVQAVISRVKMRLPRREPKLIYDEARDYQRQRIGKQPPPASAGSFFKNVIDGELAQRVEGLSEGMRKNSVVPAGFLIEACGLKGHRLGGAMIGKRHANFLLNVGGATATEIRSLAIHASDSVFEKFGVRLEEEALYLGDWSRFTPLAG